MKIDRKMSFKNCPKMSKKHHFEHFWVQKWSPQYWKFIIMKKKFCKKNFKKSLNAKNGAEIPHWTKYRLWPHCAMGLFIVQPPYCHTMFLFHYFPICQWQMCGQWVPILLCHLLGNMREHISMNLINVSPHLIMHFLVFTLWKKNRACT